MGRRKPPEPDDDLTVPEAAQMLRYDARTIRRHCEQLGAYRIGREWRIPRCRVEALLAGRVA